MEDFAIYIDTDSIYISIWNFIKKHISINKWKQLEQKEKIEYIKKTAKIIEDYVNYKSEEETKKSHYNSHIDDFFIVFEQEKIAYSGIWTSKKKYATWTLLNDGQWKNDMSITGLDIIRSDSPAIVKPMIKEVLKMLLLEYEENKIKNYIIECKEKLKKCNPEEIAINKGINKIEKYLLPNFKWRKGTSHQLKGLANFKFLLDKLNLSDIYEVPQNGNKAKVVYTQKNPFNVKSVSFLKWPKEFNEKGINVDYQKMIYTNFTKKLEDLLEILQKENLLNNNINLNSIFQ